MYFIDLIPHGARETQKDTHRQTLPRWTLTISPEIGQINILVGYRARDLKHYRKFNRYGKPRVRRHQRRRWGE